MIPVEALRLALSEEAKAIVLYRKLSVDHPSVRDVFDFLITEEEKHQQVLENKIVQLLK